jgi:F-type H+-transporting ATPase subunit b
MEILDELNPQALLIQIGSFLVLLFILRKFLWGKFLRLLDERRTGVAKELQDIEAAKTDIERLKTEYNRQLAAIDELSRHKIAEAVAQGRGITDDMRKKANLEAQSIIDAAREHIRYEISKARDTIKDEIIDLSLKAAESLIQEKLTEEDDRRLVEDFLKKLNEAE